MNNEQMSDIEILNMHYDMDMGGNFDDQEIDIHVMIDSNRQYIAELYDEIICDNYPFIVKQYCKITMYLLFIKDHHVFMNDRAQLLKKINIMKNFIQYKLFYLDNKCEINSQVNSSLIDNDVLDALLHSNTFNSKSKQRTIYDDFPISKLLYQQILDIYCAEKQIIRLKNENKSINNIPNQLEMMLIQCSNFNKISQNNIADLQYIVKEIDNFQKNVSNLCATTCKLKDNFQQLSFNKINENNRELRRQYCRNTILLNVDLMITTLNPDIILYIRSFIDEDMIDNIRIMGVQMKYFYKSKETISNMLYRWKRKHLFHYIKDHYYMIFSFDNISSSIYNYDEEDYMNHFYYHGNFMFINNYEFPCSSTRYYVDAILKHNNISQYYHFQKDVFIISNILQQKYNSNSLQQK